MCTAISVPAFTPTPSCAGQKKERASSRTKAIMHLLASRRSTSPTAMGRTPPKGLGNASREAPAKVAATSGQAAPCTSRFRTAARCEYKASEQPKAPASRKCCTHKPEGPGAVSAEELWQQHQARSHGPPEARPGWRDQAEAAQDGELARRRQWLGWGHIAQWTTRHCMPS